MHDDGKKELLAVKSGYRESEACWYEVFEGLRQRNLKVPKLITADGIQGLWKAVNKVFPEAGHQRCWVHKTANVLYKLPKTIQPKVKADLHDIWKAEA